MLEQTLALACMSHTPSRAIPQQPTGLENPPLSWAPSLLAQISLQPCLSAPLPLGGSRAPAWPETGYRAGSLGSISASDLGATRGPP